jgi:polyhydroxyalkanoate synthesis repressor PhaR
MHNLRTIKKYPNRRLYDTEESRYITLADLKSLVLAQVAFVVIDRKSNDDITNGVLMQILAEEEHSGAPLLSRDLLLQLIRTYGSPVHSSVAGHLAQSLTVLRGANTGARHHKGSGADEASQCNAAQLNFERWRALQEEMYRALTDREAEEVLTQESGRSRSQGH